MANARTNALGALALVLWACTSEERAPEKAAAPDVALLHAVYETQRDSTDNIDSPAVWHGPQGQHWLLASAKETDVIVVADAETGRAIRRVGGSGRGAGQLDRPNGIAVVDDLLWVVERDNARVQVFTLPEFRSLGSYGEKELRKPYGIAIVAEGNGRYSTYITDNYELAEDTIPPDSMLGARVRQFRVDLKAGGLSATLVNTFGDTHGAGVLRVVESIAADAVNDRLLIAEEQEGASMIKAYTLAGVFSGKIIDSKFFPSQAEGIVLYACPDRAGYWVATDQSHTDNSFHVFERASLEHVGTFRGRPVSNTDGIALTQVPFGRFGAGAFLAVNNDASVSAFQWEDIARALGLRADCR